MGKLQVIVGGQYGSEAKGAVAGHLISDPEFNGGWAVRVAGPNAGHTVIGEDGEEWKLQQVPVAAVKNRDTMLAIAPGSEVDPEILKREVYQLDEAGYKVSGRLLIDPEATVISRWHEKLESGGKPHGESGITESIGSTGKGVGAARADRIMRVPEMTVGQSDLGRDGELIISPVPTHLRDAFRQGFGVQIEGTQGYGLGLHAGKYPYCTSSDCRAIDFLAMAGLSPWVDYADLDIWVCFRTFPIRVAGNSGPMRDEIDWETISAMVGHPVQEYTTVTKKPRRVALWDWTLARDAMNANGYPSSSVHAALTFVDYWDSDLAGMTGEELLTRLSHPASEAGRRIKQAQDEDIRQPFEMFGTGPDSYTRGELS